MAGILANGIHLAYETHGDPAAPPVLLIMGMGTPLTAWPDDFVGGLVEQGFYVIAFDNRDCGLSSGFDHLGAPNLSLSFLKHLLGWPLKSAYTLNDMADDALALLTGLGIGAAHVIGASMGGMIGQILAARYPARVLSLTSIMSSSGRPSLPGPSRAARLALMRGPKNPADQAQVEARMFQVLRVIGSPAYPTPEAQLRKLIRGTFERSRGGGRAGAMRQMVAVAASGDRSALLASITCPVLVIHGAADPLLPLACGVDTAAAIAHASLHVIEGMGHDFPPQLNERLLALIDMHLHGKMGMRCAPLGSGGRLTSR
ncbi:MAG TPA: alpha/beta hydrolase [Janthinobacterium sp.]|nr:alpha/beta hydrolase [Janthinobacterium sp.]